LAFSFIKTNNTDNEIEIQIFEEKIKNLLELDGESILVKANNLHYLYISRIILIDFFHILNPIKVKNLLLTIYKIFDS
jgi:hypothetical protein